MPAPGPPAAPPTAWRWADRLALLAVAAACAALLLTAARLTWYAYPFNDDIWRAGRLAAGGRPVGVGRTAGLAGLAVVAVGAHELFGLFLAGALASAAALVYRRGQAGWRGWAVAAAAAAAGLAIVVLAPGNFARM